MQTVMTWWTQSQWQALVPGGVLVGLALALMIVEVWRPRWMRWFGYVVMAGLIGIVYLILQVWFHRQYAAFQNALVLDNVALVVLLITIVSASIVAIAVLPLWEERPHAGASWLALMLISIVGMLAMVASPDVLVIFLGLEILSLAVYVMIAYANPTAPVLESAVKYFLLGAFAAAIFGMGIALFYGATRTTRLEEFAAWASAARTEPHVWLAMLGLVLMLIALGFEISAVPFHMWTPDVYQGAPTPTVAFISVAVKAAAFAAILRIFGDMTQSLRTSPDWMGYGLAGLAGLTMIVGNVLALRQTNVKRMLAYSSIAHAGYMLIGVTVGGDAARESVLLYLLAYLFMNTGAFLVVAALEGWGIAPTLDQYRSIGYRHPAWALALTVFLIALTGIPATAGFIAKLWVFRAALAHQWVSLVIVGVITTVVAAFYYFRVVWTMFESVDDTVRRQWRHLPDTPTMPLVGFAFAVALCAFFTLQMGIWPDRFVHLVRIAFAAF